jgi:hypothetical protein
MTACPTCSGATDVPDGKGGIKPCPDCSDVRRSEGQCPTSVNNSARAMMAQIRRYRD